MNNDFNLDLLATDELLDEPTFLLTELAGEFDTDDYEYQQSTQY